MNTLILGSGYLAAVCLVRAAGFNDNNITIVDRKDPLTIVNYNQDVYRLFKRYCKNIDYKAMMDPFTKVKCGDPKRNMEIKFKLRDFEHGDEWWDGIPPPDIVFNASPIYDRLYGAQNPEATSYINCRSIENILKGIKAMDSKPFFVQFSSVNVYGDQSENTDKVITERTKPNPIGPVNTSLYFQELEVQDASDYLNYMIFRLGTLIGYFTPVTSLVNQAVLALIRQDQTFRLLNNPDESIEVFDLTDLGQIINSVFQMRNDHFQFQTIQNQIFNVKSEEPEPKTIGSLVNSLYQGVVKLPKIEGIKLKAPEIVEPVIKKPLEVNFNQMPITVNKFMGTFKWAANRPIIFSLLHSTSAYLIDYVLPLDDDEKELYKRLFAISFTPRDKDVNKDVADLKKQVTVNNEANLS